MRRILPLRAGYSLTELLVVIAIMAIAAGILLAVGSQMYRLISSWK